LGFEGRGAGTPGRADAWVNHAESWRYSVKEDSLIIGSGMVLSLVWWQDERQLLDLDSDDE